MSDSDPPPRPTRKRQDTNQTQQWADHWPLLPADDESPDLPPGIPTPVPAPPTPPRAQVSYSRTQIAIACLTIAVFLGFAIALGRIIYLITIFAPVVQTAGRDCVTVCSVQEHCRPLEAYRGKAPPHFVQPKEP